MSFKFELVLLRGKGEWITEPTPFVGLTETQHTQLIVCRLWNQEDIVDASLGMYSEFIEQSYVFIVLFYFIFTAEPRKTRHESRSGIRIWIFRFPGRIWNPYDMHAQSIFVPGWFND